MYVKAICKEIKLIVKTNYLQGLQAEDISLTLRHGRDLKASIIFSLLSFMDPIHDL